MDRLLHAVHRAARLRLKVAMALAPDALPRSGAVTAMGIDFRSRVGMAAGLDRYATLAHLAHRIGLGFVETGTVTPRPEPGHNRGIGELLKNLERYGWSDAAARAGRARLGISIGRNSSTPPAEAWRDFTECMAHGWSFADYFTLNLGSLIPMLADDRSLLPLLLDRVKGCQRALESQHYRRVPIAVKLQLRGDAREESRRLAGLVVSAGLEGILAVAGNSATADGAPERLLEELRALVGNKAAIISVGAIRSPLVAKERLQAGADLIQIHRALLYSGPAIAVELEAAARAGSREPYGQKARRSNGLGLDADTDRRVRYHPPDVLGGSIGPRQRLKISPPQS
jgi:dihydroorotate dehydrogenase